jgi:hypothetical protein
MHLTVIDPATGTRVRVTVPAKPHPERARRWVLRQLDQIGASSRS